MNDRQLPSGPWYIFQWTIPESQLQGWNINLNPIPREALAVPEVVEELGDMTLAHSVIERIRSMK